ncbi:MAG: MerR family transcriptional regulator [Acetivibrionales bacterium]|jgi:DNA-binding transcriptional MerR regulator
MEVLKERYSITELSEMLQLTDHTLRFYEKELGLSVPKDERGRRYYTPELANIMYKIKVMRSEGLEIKAIKKILQQDFVFETPRVLAEINSSSLASTGRKEHEAMQVFFHEFGKRITSELSYEMETVREHLAKEIAKTKLELGACVENGFRKLENKMEKHYEEVDIALTKWREKNKKKSSGGFLPSIFRRRRNIL